jgi:hypothetical protein
MTRRLKLLSLDRIRDAWHEAGHAVISQVLGIRVRWVSIIPDMEQGLNGVTSSEGVLELLHQWEDWRAGSAMGCSPNIAHAMISMAGYTAQRLRPRRKGQRSPRNQQGYRASRDMLNAWRALKGVRSHTPFDLLRRHDRLLQATKVLVRRHRQAIARVATALLRLDELDWLELEALVPLRRWPAGWPRPDVRVQLKQIRELAVLLRSPQQRLIVASQRCGRTA